VIIPEAVSFKCGRYLRDGHSISEYYKEKSTSDIPYATPFFQKLLHHQEQGSNISIQASPASDTSLYAQHLRALWRVHSAGQLSNNKYPLVEKRGILSAMQREFNDKTKEGKVWGPYDVSVATHHTIQALKTEQLPIFYLTEHIDSPGTMAAVSSRISADPIANQLSVLGLFEAMKKEGLLPAIGIKNSTTLDQIGHALQAQESLHSYSSPRFETYDLPANEEYYGRYEPFSNSMVGLKQKLAPEEREKLAEDEPSYTKKNPANIPNPLDKYAARLQKTEALKEALKNKAKEQNGNSGARR
jgi:hypothetical protein